MKLVLKVVKLSTVELAKQLVEQPLVQSPIFSCSLRINGGILSNRLPHLARGLMAFAS